MADHSIDEAALPPGAVTRVGPWVAGRQEDGEVFAVSRICRHQLGDMSKGTIDADGCLVCPWHQARYDTRTGRMVDGPRGFLGYHGPAPGYSAMVKAGAQVLRLRVAKVKRELGRFVISR